MTTNLPKWSRSGYIQLAAAGAIEAAA